MEARNFTLQGLIYTSRRFIVPVFQRYYSWKKREWEILWSDIEELLMPENQGKTHFMGSMVFFPLKPTMSGLQDLLIIDGQQRLLTLSILLCALRYIASELHSEILVAEINENYLFHKFAEADNRFRIYPRQRDRDNYLYAVEHITSDVRGGIGEALKYFIKRIQEIHTPFTHHDLKSIFELIKSRLEFVYIMLDGENPYQIFRSLNSTGVELSEADLIRNFVFMHLELDEQNKFDDVHWQYLENQYADENKRLNPQLITSFFRDYLMKNGDYVSAGGIFEAFEKRFLNTEFNPKKLTIDLIDHAHQYNVIRGVFPHKTESVNRSLKKLRELHTSTTYPLVLNLLMKNHDHELSDEELGDAIELISGFILRRFACSESSRSYVNWFVTACCGLGDRPVQNLKKFFLSKGFPDDIRFAEAFVLFPWYNSDYARPLLENLERSFGHKEPASLSDATIEHILPQELSDAWRADLKGEDPNTIKDIVHTVGNLTLSAYNRELFTHPFGDKKREYVKSNICLTRELAHYDHWDVENILDRGQKLAEKALKIWGGPESNDNANVRNTNDHVKTKGLGKFHDQKLEKPIKNRDMVTAKRYSKQGSIFTKMQIVLPNGTIIREGNNAETLVKLIDWLGVDRVKMLNLDSRGAQVVNTPLVSDHPIEGQSPHKLGNYYIHTHGSTSDKQEVILILAELLAEKIRIVFL